MALMFGMSGSLLAKKAESMIDFTANLLDDALVSTMKKSTAKTDYQAAMAAVSVQEKEYWDAKKKNLPNKAKNSQKRRLTALNNAKKLLDRLYKTGGITPKSYNKDLSALKEQAQDAAKLAA